MFVLKKKSKLHRAEQRALRCHKLAYSNTGERATDCSAPFLLHDLETAAEALVHWQTRTRTHTYKISLTEQQQTWRKQTNSGVEAIIGTEATGELRKLF